MTNTVHNKETLQKRLAFMGALLFAIGLFTGLWSAAALTGQVILKLPRLALSAHLNALMGGIWICLVSYTFPFLNYHEKQLKRLSLLTAIPASSNWLITLIASVLGVNGLSYNDDPVNNTIAFLLQISVVLPSLFGSVYWVRGFFFRLEARDKIY